MRKSDTDSWKKYRIVSERTKNKIYSEDIAKKN